MARRGAAVSLPLRGRRIRWIMPENDPDTPEFCILLSGNVGERGSTAMQSSIFKPHRRWQWVVIGILSIALATSLAELAVTFPALEHEPQTVFQAQVVLGDANSGYCLVYGRENCLGYNLTLPGSVGGSRIVVLFVGLNTSCPTTCWVSLESIPLGPNSTKLLVLPNLTAEQAGVMHGGPAYLLLAQPWGCSGANPCRPPPVTITVRVTDMGPEP